MASVDAGSGCLISSWVGITIQKPEGYTAFCSTIRFYKVGTSKLPCRFGSFFFIFIFKLCGFHGIIIFRR